jgi:hypothetical protein
MADGLCDWEGDRPHPRNHIITTLNPFSAVELCDDHYGPGMIPLLAAELGVDPGPFYAHVERYLKAEQKRADKALAAAQAAEAVKAEDGPSEAQVALAALDARLAGIHSGGDDGQDDDDDDGGLPEPNFYPADGPAHTPAGGDAA